MRKGGIAVWLALGVFAVATVGWFFVWPVIAVLIQPLPPGPEFTVTAIAEGSAWRYRYEIRNTPEIVSRPLCGTARECRGKTNSVGKPADAALDADKPLILPVNTPLVLQVTSKDLLTVWKVPAFGIALDAIPGRITTTEFAVLKPGLYYGRNPKDRTARIAVLVISRSAFAKRFGYKWRQKEFEQ